MSLLERHIHASGIINKISQARSLAYLDGASPFTYSGPSSRMGTFCFGDKHPWNLSRRFFDYGRIEKRELC